MDGELRLPRASVTKTLSKILNKLNEKNEASVTWTNSFFRETNTTTIRLNSLWIVGSYARGASDCGDIDVVIDYSVINGKQRPPTHLVSKALFGLTPRLRAYEGNPNENSSNIPFNEAKLIWGLDVNAIEALDVIKEDPSAVRFKRPSDVIPLRMEQLGGHSDYAEDITDAHKNKILEWNFTPLSKLNTINIESSGQQEFFDHLVRVMDYAGKDSKKLLLPLLSYFTKNKKQIMSTRGRENSSLQVDGSVILTGRPHIRVDALDGIDTHNVVAMPHITARGPNGVWTINRGENHPLVKEFSDIEMYILINNDDGSPYFRENINGYNSANELLLFSSKEASDVYLNEESEDESEKDDYTAVKIIGRDALDLISKFDVITTHTKSSEKSYGSSLNIKEIPITLSGRLVSEVESSKDDHKMIMGQLRGMSEICRNEHKVESKKSMKM